MTATLTGPEASRATLSGPRNRATLTGDRTVKATLVGPRSLRAELFGPSGDVTLAAASTPTTPALSVTGTPANLAELAIIDGEVTSDATFDATITSWLNDGDFTLSDGSTGTPQLLVGGSVVTLPYTFSDGDIVTLGIVEVPGYVFEIGTVASGTGVATSISITANAVPEDALTGSVVGVLSSDANPAATFSIVSQTPAGGFAINGNNLEVAGALNYEANQTHTITIRATNVEGSYDEDVIINITDVVEPATTVTNVAGVTIVSETDNGTTTDFVLSGTHNGKDYSGTYTVLTADVASGAPVLIVPAEWVLTANPNEYTLEEPIWLVPDNVVNTYDAGIFDSSGDPITFSDPLQLVAGEYAEYQYSAANPAGETAAPTVSIQFEPQNDIGFTGGRISYTGSEVERKYSSAFSLEVDSADFAAFERSLVSNPLQFFYDGADFKFRLTSLVTNGNTDVALGSGVLQRSFAISVDMDNYARVDMYDGTAWTTIIDITDTANLNASTVGIDHSVTVGSTNINTDGPDMILRNQHWQASDAPLSADFEVWRDSLFNADGTVRNLLPTGVVSGIAPVVFFKGQDFVNGTNSGAGTGSVSVQGPQITVTEV